MSDQASGRVYDDKPLLAIEDKAGKKIIVAVGNDSQRYLNAPNTTVHNPFDHDRALLNDFMVAEKILMHSLVTLYKRKWLRPSPLMIIHPMERIEGGLTAIELRAFRELGLGAGARDVKVYCGGPLNVRSIDFQSVVESSPAASVME